MNYTASLRIAGGFAKHNARISGALLYIVAMLGGCSDRKTVEPPPHAQDKAPTPQESSLIVVPIEADQSALTQALETEVPLLLWSINRKNDRCVAPQKVSVFGSKVNVTPPIGCTIVGQVTRGPIRLRGGKDGLIIASIPINAQISAKDVGGILKGETATGSAIAEAYIRLSVSPDWKPEGTVDLHYSWTKAPGIDFLGQRITFTDEADGKLRPIIQRLEKSLPRYLDQIDLRSQVAQLWQRSFTSLELNHENPPVWMRVTPQQLILGGYQLHNNKLRFDLGLKAITETYVGERPADPSPTPLPNLVRQKLSNAISVSIPVIADYEQLNPVILRALVKRSAQPFDLPGIGAVNARFEKVVTYGTSNGRIAVALTMTARPVSGPAQETRGLVWITARPVNEPGSAQVRFTDLSVTGDTDTMGGDLLLSFANSPAVSLLIADALTQNFTGDIADLLKKIRNAINLKREGDFILNANLRDFKIGEIHAYGDGLYLPVKATGDARIAYRP